MTTAELLQEARDLITPCGRWIKGDFEDDGAYCAVGAVRHIGRRHRITQWDKRMAIQALNCVVPTSDIMVYNDRHGTTHECILAAFDAAIEKETSK